jgi:hypothetical protein
MCQYYFDILRNPRFTATFRKLYIPPVVDSVTTSSLGEDTEVHTVYYTEARAPLHSDSIKGFGEWRILISGGAENDLREARRRDGAMFKIIIKKIRFIISSV